MWFKLSVDIFVCILLPFLSSTSLHGAVYLRTIVVRQDNHQPGNWPHHQCYCGRKKALLSPLHCGNSHRYFTQHASFVRSTHIERLQTLQSWGLRAKPFTYHPQKSFELSRFVHPVLCLHRTFLFIHFSCGRCLLFVCFWRCCYCCSLRKLFLNIPTSPL